MSDFEDEFDDDQQDETPAEKAPAKEPAWRKRLEAKAKKADALERENAFLKAGINPDDPKAKWLVKGYDGELTVDAIKAAATEAGVLAPDTAEAEQIPADERAAHERAAANATGESAGNYSYDAAIAEQRAAGNTLAVIALRQQQAAAARGE